MFSHHYFTLSKYLRYEFTPIESKNNIIKFTFAVLFDSDSNLNHAIEDFKKNYSLLEDEKLADDGTIIKRQPIEIDFSQINHSLSTFDIKIKKEKKEKIVKFGFYFFPGKTPNIGTLEYITYPLITEQNEKLFENTKKYIKENSDKFLDLNLEGTSKEQVTLNAKYYKTVIGIAGQLIRPGDSNAVMYKEGVYLKDKIIGNKQCNEIVKLISDLLKD